MHKKLGLLVLIIIAAVLTCGCTGSSSGSSSGASPAASASDDIQIVVDYDGEWSGAYGDLSGQSSIDGTGDKTITLEDAQSVVSCSFQKRDAGTGTLIVKIVQGSTVLEEKETSAQYGVVSCASSI